MIVFADIKLVPVKGEVSLLRFIMDSKADPIEKAKAIMQQWPGREAIEVIVTYPFKETQQ